MSVVTNLNALRTPQQLETDGIMCQTTQWKERTAGRLKFYRIAGRIYYSEKHLEEFFKLSEGVIVRRRAKGNAAA